MLEQKLAIRNVGVSAHIDAGKTRLTEGIIRHAGSYRQLSNLSTDALTAEVRRGISIRSAYVTCDWSGTENQWPLNQINIIDTPGHIDFRVEVERVLRVIDSVVLVVSGTEGVQSQTLSIYDRLCRYKKPNIGFISKIDMHNADPLRVFEQMREIKDMTPALMQMPMAAEDGCTGMIDLVREKALYFEGENGLKMDAREIPGSSAELAQLFREQLIDQVGMVSDKVTQDYLDDSLTADTLIREIHLATISRKLTPVFMGSSIANIGIQTLLDGIVTFLPSPTDSETFAYDANNNSSAERLVPDPDAPTVAHTFKVDQKANERALASVRVFQGRLNVGDIVTNSRTGRKTTITNLVRVQSDSHRPIDTVGPGDIVGVFDAQCEFGDTLCENGFSYWMEEPSIAKPVLSLSITPDLKDESKLRHALDAFCREDPSFGYELTAGEILIRGTGMLHLEIYLERLNSDYNVDVTIGEPRVEHRETIPSELAFAYIHQIAKAHQRGEFAKIEGVLVPNLGHGYEFESVFSTDRADPRLEKEWLPAIDRAFQDVLSNGGIIGPIIDVKVKLTKVQYDRRKSSSGAFRKAVNGAFGQAYGNIDPVVLEPVMAIEVQCPSNYIGRLSRYFNMEGKIVNIIGGDTNGNGSDSYSKVEATAPLRRLCMFTRDLDQMTSGEGRFHMSLSCFAPVQEDLAARIIQEARPPKETRRE